MNPTNRREFLQSLGLLTAGWGLTAGLPESPISKPSSQKPSDSTAAVAEMKKENFL